MKDRRKEGIKMNGEWRTKDRRKEGRTEDRITNEMIPNEQKDEQMANDTQKMN